MLTAMRTNPPGRILSPGIVTQHGLSLLFFLFLRNLMPDIRMRDPSLAERGISSRRNFRHFFSYLRRMTAPKILMRMILKIAQLSRLQFCPRFIGYRNFGFSHGMIIPCHNFKGKELRLCHVCL